MKNLPFSIYRLLCSGKRFEIIWFGGQRRLYRLNVLVNTWNIWNTHFGFLIFNRSYRTGVVSRFERVIGCQINLGLGFLSAVRTCLNLSHVKPAIGKHSWQRACISDVLVCFMHHFFFHPLKHVRLMIHVNFVEVLRLMGYDHFLLGHLFLFHLNPFFKHFL